MAKYRTHQMADQYLSVIWRLKIGGTLKLLSWGITAFVFFILLLFSPDLTGIRQISVLVYGILFLGIFLVIQVIRFKFSQWRFYRRHRIKN